VLAHLVELVSQLVDLFEVGGASHRRPRPEPATGAAERRLPPSAAAAREPDRARARIRQSRGDRRRCALAPADGIVVPAAVALVVEAPDPLRELEVILHLALDEPVDRNWLRRERAKESSQYEAAVVGIDCCPEGIRCRAVGDRASLVAFQDHKEAGGGRTARTLSTLWSLNVFWSTLKLLRYSYSCRAPKLTRDIGTSPAGKPAIDARAIRGDGGGASSSSSRSAT
jgi:hypothetical protein